MDIKTRYSSRNPLLQPRQFNTNKKVSNFDSFSARLATSGGFFPMTTPSLRYNQKKSNIAALKKRVLVRFPETLKQGFKWNYLHRDNSSHNLTATHSCGHGAPVGWGPQTYKSRVLTCTYTW